MLARTALSVALGVATSLGVPGCSEIMDPERLDSVIRCEIDSDCPEPANNRHVSVCERPEDGGDRVCVGDFARVSCDPESHGQSTRFNELWVEAHANASMYLKTCESTPGAQGCLPGPDGCIEGLEVNFTGLCDDQDPATFPAVSDFLTHEHVGHDVRDQFCKSYFCDPDMVCSRNGRDYHCARCSKSANMGWGGCYDIYLGGERSPVYLSDEDNQTSCPELADVTATRFGELPEPSDPA